MQRFVSNRLVTIVCSVLALFLARNAAYGQESAAQVIEGLTGTWQSINSEDADSERTQIMFAPVEVEGLGLALYMEVVPEARQWDPIDQSIIEVIEAGDRVLLRHQAFNTGKIAEGVFIGIGASPEHFPPMSVDRLIATHDVVLTRSGDGFVGTTGRIPTNAEDAVFESRSIEITSDRLVYSTSRMDADEQGTERVSVEYERCDPYAVARDIEGGMVIIDYPSTLGGEAVGDGDKMSVHYAGYLTDGFRFDASEPRGQPFVFQFPPGNRAIRGWGLGMEGFELGSRRKLIIPGDLGYGERGNARASIPANADLIFNVHLVELIKTPVAPVTPPVVESQTERGGDD